MTARRAIDWLERNGREIDRATVDVARGAAGAAEIAAHLEEYRNDDGGFGNALEPDVRLADSSVLATTVALQLLTAADAKADEPAVSGALGYLAATFDPDTRSWAIVPPNVSDAAHAPWWEYRQPEAGLVNPRAEILGYMLRWSGHMEPDTLEGIAAELAAHLQDADLLEMHEVLVFDRLFAAPGLPPVLESVRTRYCDLALAAIVTVPSEWGNYVLTPLLVIDGPDHQLHPQLEESVAANLDHVVDHLQRPDGSWDPPWSWFGHHDDVWPTAERDIRSKITADYASRLIRFGRD